MNSRSHHTHRCTCGSLLTCAYDRCAAASQPWICDACEMDLLDAYINDKQTRLLDAHNSTTHTAKDTKREIN